MSYPIGSRVKIVNPALHGFEEVGVIQEMYYSKRRGLRFGIKLNNSAFIVFVSEADFVRVENLLLKWIEERMGR